MGWWVGIEIEVIANSVGVGAELGKKKGEKSGQLMLLPVDRPNGDRLQRLLLVPKFVHR